MFGLLYTAVVGIGLVGNSIKKDILSEQYRQQAIAEGRDVWTDARGKMWDVASGRQVMLWWENGSRQVIDVHTRQVLRDSKKMDQQKRFSEGKDKYNPHYPFYTVVDLGHENGNNHLNQHVKYYKGHFYKDIKTGQIFYKRTRPYRNNGVGGNFHFYATRDGYAVRFSDDQRKRIFDNPGSFLPRGEEITEEKLFEMERKAVEQCNKEFQEQVDKGSCLICYAYGEVLF